MRLNYVRIENFRNFRFCEVQLGENIVLVGENKAGKSNFIQALRLVLDPSMSDIERRLTAQDFWDGIEPFQNNQISITLQFTDFGNDPNPDYLPLSLLNGDCIITTAPEPIAQLTYLYANVQQLDSPEQSRFEDYDFKIYPGNNIDKEFKNIRKLRENIPLMLISAIRDIANDNRVWSRSPLSRLIELTELDSKQLEPFAEKVKAVSDDVLELEPLTELQTEIQSRLNSMVGELYTINPELGLNATTVAALEKDLRLFADGEKHRALDRSSLGLQNALYLALLALFLEKQEVRRSKNKERFLPIVALEEPEAHLHPHLQRLVFDDYLNTARNRRQPVIISTHSPHLACSSPINDLVLLRETINEGTDAKSAFQYTSNLSSRKKKDLDRFLDITKSEMLFSKGVLFVEGDVEVILVSEFARILNKPLDKFGISVINVYGTNFSIITDLAFHLGIPFAVLTDGDPKQNYTGLRRGIDILLNIIDSETRDRLSEKYNDGNTELVRRYLRRQGVFVNKWTLEPTLFEAGLENELKQTFLDLGEEMGQSVRAGANHIDVYLTNPTEENMMNILTSIADTRWGKGRFAHRLVGHIISKAEILPTQAQKDQLVPAYIQNAVNYLISKVISQRANI